MRRVMVCLSVVLGLAAGSISAEAEQDGADTEIPTKFEVRDTVLVYDTEQDELGDAAEIERDDVDMLRDLLRENPQVTTLDINSGGGNVFAAYDMARIVIEFGLDTIVMDYCTSACVSIFLAGNTRRMRLGAGIGFHQTSWGSASIERYYERNRKGRGWSDPFAYASWIYGDTQTEVYKLLAYMVERGVDPAFAIETIRTENSDMWYPSRIRLMGAGVLREVEAQD